MKPSFRFLKVGNGVLTAWLLAVGAAYGFVLPDTVDLRTNPAPTPSDFVINTTGDSLILDSISIGSRHVPGGTAQLVFSLATGTTPNAVTRSYNISFMGNGQTTQAVVFENPRFAIPGGATARLVQPRFDHCVFCPTAKRAATSAIGDSLKAMIVFHSGTQRDSVRFLSIERVSTGILPFSALPEIRGGSWKFIDVTGRTVRPEALQYPGLIRAPRH